MLEIRLEFSEKEILNEKFRAVKEYKSADEEPQHGVQIPDSRVACEQNHADRHGQDAEWGQEWVDCIGNDRRIVAELVGDYELGDCQRAENDAFGKSDQNERERGDRFLPEDQIVDRFIFDANWRDNKHHAEWYERNTVLAVGMQIAGLWKSPNDYDVGDDVEKAVGGEGKRWHACIFKSQNRVDDERRERDENRKIFGVEQPGPIKL